MGFDKPIIIIFTFLFVTILIIMGIPLLSGVSLVSATDSANLTSFGTSYSELLPWFGLLVVGGVLAFAFERGR